MQAPIGASVTPGLVAAVGLAGGLGTFACNQPHVLAERIHIARAIAGDDLPFAVNLLASTDTSGQLEVVLDLQVPIVHFSRGVHRQAIDTLKRAGRRCTAQVGTGAEAREAERAGVDVLIVQSLEAGGGIQGEAAGLQTLQQVLATTSLPVLAAGGISSPDRAGDAVGVGAAGVMAGTVFVTTPESASHPLWAEAIIASTQGDSTLTDLFNEGDRSYRQRVLRSDAVIEWEQAGRPPLGQRPGEGSVVADFHGQAVRRYDDVPPLREMTGDLHLLQMPAGTGAADITHMMGAGEVVTMLAAVAHAASAR